MLYVRGRQRILDANGNPVSGALANFYLTQSSTRADTYQDVAQTTPHTNPVVANSAGFLAPIYLNPDITYRCEITDSLGGSLPDGIVDPVGFSPIFGLSPNDIGLVLYPRTAGEIAASVTPTNYQYAPGDIRRYGAVLDGATDDTLPWSKALLSNFRIYFPSGTSIVSNISPRSGTEIFSDGPSSILKQKNSAEFINVITFVSKSGLILRDFQIDGNGAAQPSGEHKHGVDIEESTDVIIDGLTIHDCQGDAIYVASATDPVTAARIKIVNNTIYNLGRQGITIAGKGARGVTVKGNNIRVGTYVSASTSHGNPIHLEQDAVPAAYAGDVVIEGNVCTDAGISSSGAFSGLTIAHNIIRTPKYTASPWGIGLVNPNNVTITGNTIIGDNSTVIDGIYIQDSGPSAAPAVKNITVTGNTIEQVAGHGVTIFGTDSGIPSLGQLTVTGNTVLTVGTGGAKNGINILTPFKDATVMGNIVRAPTNLGIVLQGETAAIVMGNKVSECGGTYGIYLDIQGSNVPGPVLVSGNFVGWATPAGKTGVFCQNSSNATRVSVIGNDLGSTATPVAFGSGVVKSGSWANIGGNDSPVGSFTLAAAATTVVNNANVTALCKIILVPTNAAAATLMGSNKALYISTRTAGTSFTVATASAAAAAGTETFDYWVSV